MPLITIKVDEKLKNDAGAVLEELGLDLPTAVRMYLKAVVREKGLSITPRLNTPVNAAPAAEEPAEEPVPAEAPVKKRPGRKPKKAEPAREEPAPEPAPAEAAPAPKTAKRVAVADFLALICSVPAGSVTRWSDMEAALSAKAGVEVTRPQHVRWPKTLDDGTAIPYWRIVTERGGVRGDRMIDKDEQEAKLAEEGHTFAPSGHDKFSGIKVADYKKKLMKF